MFYKNILFFFLIMLFSCTGYETNKEKKFYTKKPKFSTEGFTIIYAETLFDEKIVNNKLDDRSLLIFQKNLKKGTTVKITNLINSKSIVAKVSKKTKYPSFFNSVVSSRIAIELEIDPSEPYIEIREIPKNSMFVAGKSKTFEEEKTVADSVPVDDIKIKDLSKKKNIKKKEKAKKEFNYIIKVADFYYESSANSMLDRIKKETSIKKPKIAVITNTEYRVFLGPFKNLSTLKEDFNAISTLQFDNIEIIKK